MKGESIPVIKTPLPENDEKSIYNVDNDNKHTLFSGTIVVQARPAKIGGKVQEFSSEFSGFMSITGSCLGNQDGLSNGQGTVGPFDPFS